MSKGSDRVKNQTIEVGDFGQIRIEIGDATVFTGAHGVGSLFYRKPTKGPEELRAVFQEACDATIRWLYPNEVDTAWLWEERRRLFKVSLQFTSGLDGITRGQLNRTGTVSCGVCGTDLVPTSPHVLAVNDLGADESPLSRGWHSCCDECARNIDPDSLALRCHPQESLEGSES